MKLLLGLHAKNGSLSFVDKNGNPLTTEYKDRGRLTGTLNKRLDWLGKSLNREITIAAPYIMTLEELTERYYDDCKVSFDDGNIGFFMRYQYAFERSKAIADYSYSLIPPII